MKKTPYTLLVLGGLKLISAFETHLYVSFGGTLSVRGPRGNILERMRSAGIQRVVVSLD